MRATYRLVFNYGVVTMKSNRTIRFACDSCGKKFQAEPDRITESDVRSAHPWDYFALCPDCGKEAPQIWWEKNIFRAWHKATGPKTTEGKKRSRLNALTHGLRAQTLSFFPARPGQYSHCKGCAYLNTEETEKSDCVDFNGCLKRAELYLKHQIAFETGDISLLRQTRATTQAGLQALIDDMILAIIADGGPRITTPEWYSDKDGNFHLARFVDEQTGETIQIHKLTAHPLLKPLIEYIAKNKMTLEDLEMTDKQQTQEAALKGHLETTDAKRQALEDFNEQIRKQNAGLAELIGRSLEKHEPQIIEGELNGE